MGETEEVLSRFHAALVDEIRAQRPNYLTGPFTVAEIYQELVPYGSHRDRIGVEMNGDYEDALLRLLAGEGGYLILDSEPALRRLREELDGSNPNTGLYREYAAVDVRLNSDRLAGGAVLSPELPLDAEELPLDDPSADEPQGEDAIISTSDVAPADVAADVAAANMIPADGGTDLSGEPSSDPEPPTACRWCRAELPKRDNVSFCPFCGTDVNVVPCPGCGEELELAWRFCVACGTEVDA